MKRLSALFGTSLFVVLAVVASQVRADWSYTGTPNVPGVTVGATSPGGGASVTLTGFSTPQTGGASIPVEAYVTSTSLTTPVTFSSATETPSSYSLAVTIKNTTTGDSGTLNFTGTIAGTLSATTSSLVNTLTPVGSNVLPLDGYNYTITIPQVTLAAPTSPQQDIMANVSVTPANSGGGVTPPVTTGVPEPASLVLGSLGFSCLGLSCLWKRRSHRPEEAA